MTRHPHRRTITGAPRLIRRASLVAVAALAVAAAPSSAATGAQFDGDTLQIFGDNGEQKLGDRQPAEQLRPRHRQQRHGRLHVRPQHVQQDRGGRQGRERPRRPHQRGGALDKPITVDGGAGNDTLRGAAGNEKLLGGSGDDDIDGNIGADTVDGGSGNDRIEWDPGDGSDTVDGARAATRSTSTAPTSVSRSASPPTALAHASRATSRRSTSDIGTWSRFASAPSAARTP
jgi:Ca2+-binding RTX toxin-like protein